MTNSRLMKILFNRRNGKKGNTNKTTVPPSSASSSSSPPSATRQELVRTLNCHPQEASPFFSLPGELRNKIYYHANHPSLLCISIYKSPAFVFAANIFHVCRRMRSEAISHLCASKSFNLSNLYTSNEFFELIRDGLPSLRYVTIRCPIVWCIETEEIRVEKRDLLDYLELATGLLRLSLIIKGPMGDTQEEEEDFKDSESIGAKFLHDVRGVVERHKLSNDHGKDEDSVFRLCTFSHLDCWRKWSCRCGSWEKSDGVSKDVP